MQNKSKTNTVLLVIIIILLAIGLVYLYWNNQKKTEVNNLSQENKNVGSILSQETTKEYKNNELGLSFNYFKEFGEINYKNGSGTTGKNFFARQGCEEGSKLCLFIGGTTPDYTFPGELNANDVSIYPSEERLQSLAQNGYRNEKKINSQGEEYVLIYGRKEVDMPYISEGQAVAIFKLKSSANFKVIGFMLVNGDLNYFLKTVDTIKIF